MELGRPNIINFASSFECFDSRVLTTHEPENTLISINGFFLFMQTVNHSEENKTLKNDGFGLLSF